MIGMWEWKNKKKMTDFFKLNKKKRHLNNKWWFFLKKKTWKEMKCIDSLSKDNIKKN